MMRQIQNLNGPMGKILGFLIFLIPWQIHRDRLR